MQERYINRVAAGNIIKGEIYLFCFGQKFECGNLTLLEFHFCLTSKKNTKKINSSKNQNTLQSI